MRHKLIIYREISYVMWGWIREMDGGGNVMGDRDHKVIYYSNIKRQYETEWGE
jgi:hypothetical protein